MSYHSGKRTGSKNHQMWPGMSERQHYCLHRYIRAVADSMGLQHWQLLLSNNPAKSDDCIAHVDVCEGRHVATIYVCEEWMTLSNDERRHTIAHELLHLHHADLTDDIRLSLVKTSITQPEYDVVWEQFRLGFERMVDDLAVIICHYSDDTLIEHYLEGRKSP